MKLRSYLILSFAALTVASAFGQTSSAPQSQSRTTEHGLTKFDLDFPGGTPGELVAAIQKAMGRPLNVIVPTEFASHLLPPLKMSSVDVAQLFRALVLASQDTRFNNGMQEAVYNGFETDGKPPTDDSVWYFFVRERHQQYQSRFYLLTPYLDRGLTVDDITTAIQTAWKMQGNEGIPTMSFHKETKLLIAVGDTFRLETIDRALEALKAPAPKSKSTAEMPANSEEKKP